MTVDTERYLDFVAGVTSKPSSDLPELLSRITQLDCTDDADDDPSEIQANQALRDKFDIKGYPTIKLITEGEEGKNVIDFDSKITSKGLETFVQSILK